MRDLVLESLIGEQLWRREAACLGVGTARFFPTARGVHSSVVAAKRLCAICGVGAECGQYALDHTLNAGVWFGHSLTKTGGRRELKAHLDRLNGVKEKAACLLPL